MTDPQLSARVADALWAELERQAADGLHPFTVERDHHRIGPVELDVCRLWDDFTATPTHAPEPPGYDFAHLDTFMPTVPGSDR